MRLYVITQQEKEISNLKNKLPMDKKLIQEET